MVYMLSKEGKPLIPTKRYRKVRFSYEDQDQLMQKYGWVVHYVFETDAHELHGLANIHTHGLQENFDHSDFQVVLPIDPKVIHPVLNSMVQQIKEGKQFQPGKSSFVLRGFDVLFLETTENNRPVLRLILPDPNGKFPGDPNCQSPYSLQLESLPDK